MTKLFCCRRLHDFIFRLETSWRLWASKSIFSLFRLPLDRFSLLSRSFVPFNICCSEKCSPFRRQSRLSLIHLSALLKPNYVCVVLHFQQTELNFCYFFAMKFFTWIHNRNVFVVVFMIYHRRQRNIFRRKKITFFSAMFSCQRCDVSVEWWNLLVWLNVNDGVIRYDNGWIRRKALMKLKTKFKNVEKRNKNQRRLNENQNPAILIIHRWNSKVCEEILLAEKKKW